MHKKLLVTVLCILLMAFIFSACNTGTGTTKTDNTTGATSSGTGASTQRPPAELTWYLSSQGTVWQEYDFTNSWFTKYIEEKANVKITKITTPPHADIWTKFEMLIASGDLMDIAYGCTSNDNVKKYGMDGALLAVDDYIDKSPIISKIYNPAQREYIKADDGKTYAVWGYPVSVDFGTNTGFAYRADLLKKVGLEKPETLEGWVEAMLKVKKEIPNVIPYSTFRFSQYYEFMFSPFNIMFSYGPWIFDDANNTFKQAINSENMMKAIAFGRMLFKEGLLDNEFMTHTKADYTNKIYSNNMLIIAKNRGGINEFIPQYAIKGVDGAKLMPSWYPAADGIKMEDGVYKHWGPLVGFPMVINSKTKNPDACIRVIEVLLSDEVKNMIAYGREGHEYKVVNGEIVPIEPAATENGWRLAYGYLFGVNTVERMNYNAYASIDAITSFTAEEKAAYKNEFAGHMTELENKIMMNKPRNTAYMGALDDATFNKRSESSELKVSLMAKAIMGDITLEEFKAEADKIAANDADIVDAMNKLMAEAVKKYNLK